MRKILTVSLGMSLAFCTIQYLKPFDFDKINDVDDVFESVEQPTEKLDSSFDKIKSMFSFDWMKLLALKNMPFGLVLLIAFLLGIISSFTPCIYPMIPITIGILQSQASKSIGRNFLLSTSYVFGIATVYSVLGYIAAVAPNYLAFGELASNPIFIGFLILLFLYLAFSMFGFYEIYMPRFLQGESNIKVKGSFVQSFLFGAIAGPVTSPCLAPPLAILLSYVAYKGNPVIGLITLFVFSLGMGILLILVGTFSNTLTSLPRAGAWMNKIKTFFGFLLIGVSIYFLKPFISANYINILYALLAITMIIYYAKVIFLKK